LDGFKVGFYKNGIRSYIGRGYYIDTVTPGRIQTTGTSVGLKIVYGGASHSPTQSVEFLVYNPRYHYIWVTSSGGATVENEVKVSQMTDGNYYRVGRVFSGAYTFIVKVFGSGATYEAADGTEKATTNYQVLTCVPA
jgi:hypothetical protein